MQVNWSQSNVYQQRYFDEFCFPFIQNMENRNVVNFLCSFGEQNFQFQNTTWKKNEKRNRESVKDQQSVLWKETTISQKMTIILSNWFHYTSSVMCLIFLECLFSISSNDIQDSIFEWEDCTLFLYQSCDVSASFQNQNMISVEQESNLKLITPDLKFWFCRWFSFFLSQDFYNSILHTHLIESVNIKSVFYIKHASSHFSFHSVFSKNKSQNSTNWIWINFSQRTIKITFLSWTHLVSCTIRGRNW